MASTSDPLRPLDTEDWRAAGLRYHRLSWHFRRVFGRKVRKVTVDAGLGCPNRDGNVGRGGCVFCDPRSFSPARRSGIVGIAAQLAAARRGATQEPDACIAYFQPGTNTYGPVERLRAVYDEALAQPGVVGLAVGTRPDCLGDDVLSLLAEIHQRTWLILELGVQSLSEASLQWIGRGHNARASLDAIARAKAHNLRVGAHVILGLPGESADTMFATATELGRAGIDAVKLHNLYAVRETRLAGLVAAGSAVLPDREEYADWVVGFLQRTPGRVVIDRLSGDAPAEYLVAPAWCADKAAIRQQIEAKLVEQNAWQGQWTPE